MRNIIITVLFLFSAVFCSFGQKVDNRSLKGVVRDKLTGENLVGVNIYLSDLKRGTVTDNDGYYELKNLPLVKTTIQVTYIGHQTIIQSVNLNEVKQLNFEMEESSAKINEIVVTAFTGNSLIAKMPAPISYVSKEEMLIESSSNIIDAIAKQPGISQVTTGSGISKPVIRGLGYNRVLVVNNGVRQEGQQWGDEHGVEIDAQSVNSVEILKGPASLVYGSDAMAGVIRFLPLPVLSEGNIKANVYTEYQTNNGLINYSLNMEGNLNDFVWNVRYGDKFAHSYKNKYDGYVFNSGFKEKAISGLFGINKNWGYSHFTLSYYHIQPGIVQGNRDHETGKFLKPSVVDGEVEYVEADKNDSKSYGKHVPYQQVYHYMAIWDNNIYVGKGNLKSIIGYQQNRRQEFEDVIHPKDYVCIFSFIL